MRLDRWLTSLGFGSRSQVGALIRRGGVQLNGAAVRDPGASCDPERDRLTVGGEPADGRLTRHVLLHKPAGLLTAARDRKQPTVMDLLPPVYASLGCMPVGRLDKDTTGLLLFTTDGELNHRLLAPGRHVDKVYLARTEGRAGEKEKEAFRAGILLDDGPAAPAELEVLEASEEASTVRITLHEGRFHQVKRMCAAVGHPVITLHREAFGPLRLEEDLAPGAWRELTEEETAALYRAAGMMEL